MSGYRLKIVLDTAFNYSFIQNASIESDTNKQLVYFEYDTIYKELYFIQENLKPGNYTFVLNTIFNKEIKQNFHFNAPLKIRIENPLHFQKVNAHTLESLQKADSVEIVLHIRGCFTDYVEKTLFVKDLVNANFSMCTKSNNNWEKDQNPLTNKSADLSVIDSILKLQNKSIEAHEAKLKLPYIISSTTTQQMYILAKNKLFSFSDQGLIAWDLYDRFKRNSLRIK